MYGAIFSPRPAIRSPPPLPEEKKTPSKITNGTAEQQKVLSTHIKNMISSSAPQDLDVVRSLADPCSVEVCSPMGVSENKRGRGKPRLEGSGFFCRLQGFLRGKGYEELALMKGEEATSCTVSARESLVLFALPLKRLRHVGGFWLQKGGAPFACRWQIVFLCTLVCLCSKFGPQKLVVVSPFCF